VQENRDTIASEERVLYIALIIAGAPPVIGALLAHQPFGGGVSLCLGLVALGLVGIVGRRRTARNQGVPKARMRVRR
jgi:VIT1/CCC1 family predicted Fe2+/Mn2+ transporter